MIRRKSKQKRNYHLVTHTNPRSTVSEVYRTLRTNIQFAGVDNDIRSILITSSGPGEGKSTTVTNLAVTFAQTGKKVILIDADMRRPTIHHYFQLANSKGLSHVLAGLEEIDEVVQATQVDGLSVITSGPIPPNQAEMLGSKRMQSLLEALTEQYDYVLIDSPPVVPVTDAQVLASRVDGVILVIDSGNTKREMAVKAKQLLDHVHARIIGTVLNRRESVQDQYYYYY